MAMAETARDILAWLAEQERAMARWRDEVAAKGDADVDDLERLERHRRWLADALGRLNGGRSGEDPDDGESDRTRMSHGRRLLMEGRL